MNKVKRFSLEERYGYQNRKVIYDKNTDNDFDDMNDCLCAIDNQIKRLTHQREDKGECNV